MRRWLALTLFLFAVGCAKTVELADLRKISDADLSDRRVFLLSDGIDSSARIASQDILNVRADSGDPLWLSVPDGPTLAANAVSLQIPVWVLAEYGSLSIHVGSDSTRRVGLCAAGAGRSGCDVVIGGATLGQTAAALSQTRLQASIIPISEIAVVPGDQVSVRLEHFVRPAGTQAGNYLEVLSSESRVAGDGTLSVPTLSVQSALVSRLECDRFPEEDGCAGGLPAPDGVPDRRAFSRERGVAQALDAAQRKIVVWRPDRQVLLWHVERCLNTIGWLAKGRVDRDIRAFCAGLGIDERLYPLNSPEVFWPRYFLTASEPTWRLVDMDGDIHELPFVGGRDVESAVREAWRRIKGNELDQVQTPFGATPYITVVPTNGNPFFGQLSPERSARSLDAVSLQPSDVVHVTMYAPSAIESDGED